MQLHRNWEVDLKPVDPHTFTGEARYQLVLESTQGKGVRVYDVRFDPGARTHWHRHSGVQLLLVQEGHGYVQREGQEPTPISAGDLIQIDPGERHWHGASATQGLGHLAINIAAETEWLGPVADDEYPLK